MADNFGRSSTGVFRTLVGHEDARSGKGSGRLVQDIVIAWIIWLRGEDLNLRPSGYEPDELPGCSTPRVVVMRLSGLRFRAWVGVGLAVWGGGSTAALGVAGVADGRGVVRPGLRVAPMRFERVYGVGRGGVGGGLREPGGDLLFRVLRRSTIGAEGFHGRVRDGIGCLAPRCGHQAVAAPVPKC